MHVYYMYFQQVAQRGPLRSREWAKRKKRLIAFFTGNVKVKIHVLNEDVLLLLSCVTADGIFTFEILNADYKSFH